MARRPVSCDERSPRSRRRRTPARRGRPGVTGTRGRCSLAMLATRLGKKGYDVLTAADGEMALAQARAHRPALVLLDVMMPGKSGLEVLRELRADEQLQAIGVVMITAIGETWNAMTALLY